MADATPRAKFKPRSDAFILKSTTLKKRCPEKNQRSAFFSGR
jgi:hypothetical protein